jgi:DNA-binding response OmpR family regulator
MEGASVLVVEDDAAIGGGLVAVLREEGYDVRLAATAAGALAQAEHAPPQLVLLDLGLPDADGLSVCRQLRGRFPDTKIVVVTARTDETDVVLGFDTGANDYVAKPFRLAELLARVRAQLRDPVGAGTSKTVVAGDLSVDRDARRAQVAGVDLELRPKEFDLLALLAANAGSTVMRDRIMSEVWHSDWYGTTKTLDMHISSLRKKLAGATVRITTLRHVGYRLDV